MRQERISLLEHRMPIAFRINGLPAKENGTIDPRAGRIKIGNHRVFEDKKPSQKSLSFHKCGAKHFDSFDLSETTKLELQNALCIVSTEIDGRVDT